MDEIYGYIERITFQNPETGYTVAKLQQYRKKDLTVVVGHIPSVQVGETIRCQGQWKSHLIHGMQFVIERCTLETPADVEGLKKYLGSGLIKGIGPTYADRIVDMFGSETLHIIDKEPDRLHDVPGLGKKRVEKIASCWQDQKSIRDVMIFLQKYGVSPTYAQKIFKTYGNQSIQKVSEDPYCLARDIFGIGFGSADKIAASMGIQKEAPARIDSGIEYTLSQLSSDGHVCYPVEEFLLEAAGILEIDKELVRDRIKWLVEANRVVVSDLVFESIVHPFIWLRPLFLSEIGIAKELRRLLRAQSSLRAINNEKAIEWVQEKLNIRLADNQKIAVIKSLSEKVKVITGGPGTGKSTITNAILTITGALTDNIILAAPTGRAAKRMTEITGKKAQTIHSLLEFDFKKMGFKRDRSNPLECDLIIVDEASMIDTSLMYSLLKAVPDHARLIFVGDINQLPSVGPGNVLKDFISSDCLSVTMLNEIFRQAEGSRIITNSHRINQGTFPDIRNLSDSDFFFIEAEEKEDVMKQILSLVTLRLPKKYGFHPMKDIQVLSPMKKGVVGTENLNMVLQEALNKKSSYVYQAGKKLQVDDKVMQIRNNYKKEVYNGDIGYVTKIDNVEQKIYIDFDSKSVEYDFRELDEVVLAYVVSVHKFQGSECPCVVMPVHTTHFKMLHRNLFYTGVTRGKKLVVIIGNKKAISIAVRNDEVKRRYTGLTQSIVGLNNRAAV